MLNYNTVGYRPNVRRNRVDLSYLALLVALVVLLLMITAALVAGKAHAQSSEELQHLQFLLQQNAIVNGTRSTQELEQSHYQSLDRAQREQDRLAVQPLYQEPRQRPEPLDLELYQYREEPRYKPSCFRLRTC